MSRDQSDERRRVVRASVAYITLLVFVFIALQPQRALAQTPQGHFALHGDLDDYVTGGQSLRTDCNYGYRFATYDTDHDGVPEALTLIFGTWVLTINSSYTGRGLTPGTFEDASSQPSEAEHTPEMSFSGDGRGCPESVGRFEILDAGYDTEHPDEYGNPTVQRFAIRIQQSCEASLDGPGLYGILVFNSTVALDLESPVVAGVTVSRTKLRRSRRDSTTISWSASDNVAVKRLEVRWSPDGAGYESLAYGLPPGTTSYTWSVPATAPLTRSGVIKVVAVDENGNAGEAVYAGKITIKR